MNKRSFLAQPFKPFRCSSRTEKVQSHYLSHCQAIRSLALSKILHRWITQTRTCVFQLIFACYCCCCCVFSGRTDCAARGRTVHGVDKLAATLASLRSICECLVVHSIPIFSNLQSILIQTVLFFFCLAFTWNCTWHLWLHHESTYYSPATRFWWLALMYFHIFATVYRFFVEIFISLTLCAPFVSFDFNFHVIVSWYVFVYLTIVW